MNGLSTIWNLNNLPKLPPGFNVGDKVVYNGHKGVILKSGYPVKEDGNNLGALIEYEDKDLIPSQMGIPYRSLKHRISVMLSVKTHCPVCSAEWKETVGNRDVWYDCLKCGKTKEDITEERK